MVSLSSKFKLSRPLLIFGLSVSTLSCAHAVPTNLCPARQSDIVKYIDVFDGRPNELAYLAPDSQRSGVDTFIVGGIYDSGRSVTVRCKYASGQITDIEIKQKVDMCAATRTGSGGVSVQCH
jgi:hypothetical protein